VYVSTVGNQLTGVNPSFNDTDDVAGTGMPGGFVPQSAIVKVAPVTELPVGFGPRPPLS